MKKNITSLLVIGVFLMVTYSCEKEDDNDKDNGNNGNQEAECIDGDGNLYKTVEIGEQEWMAENLRTTTYNDGSPIPNITDKSDWEADSSGAYCWYDDDSAAYVIPYGALYNWHAVNTGKLCPKGWRVSTDKDWKILEGTVDSVYDVGDLEWNGIDYRGYDAGMQLKSDSGWAIAEFNGPDDYGFSAFPGGDRYFKGYFQNSLGNRGKWWTSTETSASSAWFRRIQGGYDDMRRHSMDRRSGLSVRCLRDM